MKTTRGIVGGLVFGVISELAGWLVYGVLFASAMEQTAGIWRPMDSAYWRIGMPLTDLFSGLMVALGFAVLHKGIPGEGAKKGVIYGLILWLITRVAGELFSYSMLPVPFTVVVAGWTHGLIVALVGGAALGAICAPAPQAAAQPAKA
ncbi:MAG: hypothetical protein HYY13_08620 [Nitrospirae bacterium]|nr:hypothetical protein [Nitrospirota bacterium]